MKTQTLKASLIILLTIITLGMATSRPMVAHGASNPIPTIGVWSNFCSSFNMTTTSCPTSSLTVGNTISVQINITNNRPYNAFETALYYDPTFLNATLIDLHGSFALGTKTVWTNPFSVESLTTAMPGAVFISMTNLGQTPISTDGILANINFTIRGSGVSPLTLAAGMAQPSGNAIALSGTKVDWTRLVLGGTPYDTATSDGYYMNETGSRGPVAVFSYSPARVLTGHTVTFSGAGSYDLDNPAAGSTLITHYYWDFGDGSNGFDSPTVEHVFGPRAGAAYVGNFSVRLTVTDQDSNFTGMITQRVLVSPPPLHDVGIVGISATPSAIDAGGKVSISVSLQNKGTYDENFNLTVSYGTNPVVRLGYNQSIVPASSRLQYTYSMDTTGLSAGSYQVTAVVRIPVANVTSDETASVIVTVTTPGSSSQLLYIALGAVGVIAALAIVGILLRRRRRPEEP